MNATEVEIVRRSMARCTRNPHTFFDTFYGRLGRKHASIGPMFAETDMSQQNQLVERGIGHLIDFAAGSTDAEARIHELGQLHGRHQLDVPPDLYPLWVEALLEAVREHDGECDSDVETAWQNVLERGIRRIQSLY